MALLWPTARWNQAILAFESMTETTRNWLRVTGGGGKEGKRGRDKKKNSKNGHTVWRIALPSIARDRTSDLRPEASNTQSSVSDTSKLPTNTL